MEQRELALTMPETEAHSLDAERLPHPDLAPVVFCCLKQMSRLRHWCLKVALSPVLDDLSILMVLLNCVSLAIYKPGVEKSSGQEIADLVVFAFFLVEMLVKMVALGVSGHEGSYLRSIWHKLDFFINCGGVLDYSMKAFGMYLQFCQVLGPLRLISRVPSIRGVVTVLLGTVPMLTNVFILLIFVIFVFSVVGVQLWAGQLRNRCFLGEDIPGKYNVSLCPFFMTKNNERFPFICSPDGESGMRRCHDVPPYRENGEICSLAAPRRAPAVSELFPTVANACVNWNLYYNVCRAGEHNPQMGAINFDNIAYAWIAIFQVVTLKGWAEIMYYVMDAHSFFSFLFFILVTIMGSFVMMNVCAVVIATQFSDNMEQGTGEQSGVAAALKRLCRRLTSWLQSYCENKRHRNRVQPDGGRMKISPMRRVNNFLQLHSSRHVASLMKGQLYLKKIANSKLFDQVVMAAVFLSILTMVIDHHNQPRTLKSMLYIAKITFTTVFVMEMVLKLLVHNWRYFQDRNNIYDFSIVIMSLWEIIAKFDGKLSVLRAFRLLRFVKLLQFLPYVKRQLQVLKRAIEEAATLCMLQLIVIFIFSILGMHLFGGQFTFQTPHGDTAVDRKNFDTLLWAMVTVFQILTQEKWHVVLYNAMATTSPWAAVYFVAVIVVGKLILLNILVGIVVRSFKAWGPDSSHENSSLHSSGSASSPPVNLTSENPSQTDSNKKNKHLNWKQKMLRWCKDHEDWSFYMLSPNNKFRIFCQRLISHKMFDPMVLFFIYLNCITIVMERPGIAPDSTERRILIVSRHVFSVIFLFEMLFKVLALGLLFGKDSYCRSLWNVVDGLLVILSFLRIILSLARSGENNMLGILKVLRLIRTFRPLRVIKRAPKLKLAVEALIASVKPIGNILVICCMFFIFYGILGVQLFKGRFYHCVGEDLRSITNKTDCLSANYRWMRKKYNFDSLPQALMSLFIMYSNDGWVSLMYDGLDAVGVDKQPVRNHNEWMLIFFITFMVMSFFLLDVFIGVMVETFHLCQQELKQGNREALQGQCAESEEPYYTHYSPLRRSIHTLSTSNSLDLFITFIIFISVLMMAFEHYNQPPYIGLLTEYSHYVFTAILIVEVLLKLVAFGIRRFIQNRWNLLDIAVVIISIISIIFINMNMEDRIPINPSILRVSRALRLAQVLKAKKIRVLLNTINKTLLQGGNICLLFALFFTIYAALGVELFGKLECSEDYPCLGLTRHTNFKHFGKALLTLYQVCTGDNWSMIMKDTLRECRPGNSRCLSYLPWVSPIYFISFVVMAQFVLVNLVVAAIMQALADSHSEKDLLTCPDPDPATTQGEA